MQNFGRIFIQLVSSIFLVHTLQIKGESTLAKTGSTQNSTFFTLENSVKEDVEKVELLKCSDEVEEKFLIISKPLSSESVGIESVGIEENSALLYNFTLINTESRHVEGFTHQTNCTVQVEVSLVQSQANEVLNTNKTEGAEIKRQSNFSPFGFLSYNGTIFNPKNYCISKITEKDVTAQVCLASCGISQPAISIVKCCSMGKAYELTSGRCKPIKSTDRDWAPNLYSDSEEHFSDSQESSTNPNYVVKPPICNDFKIILPYQLGPAFSDYGNLNDVHFLKSGEIRTRISGNHPWRKLTGLYCVDGLLSPNVTGDLENVEENAGSSSSSGESERKGFDSNKFVIITCVQDDPDENMKESMNIVYLSVLSISAAILFAINVIYAVLWKTNTQNVHAWTTNLLCTCMFLWFLSLIVSLVYATWGHNYYGTETCAMIGIVSHFYYISTFSAMTVLNFDLYSTISSMTAMSLRSQGRKRFFLYCLFTFGTAGVVISISCFIQFQFGTFDDRLVRPQYGRTRCNLDHTAVLYYGVIPTAILFGLSLIFSILTLKTLRQFQNETKRVKGTKMNTTNSNTRKYKSEFSRACKLFIIMGISWIFDFVSAIAVGPHINWYWAILDFYNILQAIGLFWIFVCKKDIKKQLGQKFPILKKSGFMSSSSCCFIKTRKLDQDGLSASTLSTSFSHISLKNPTFPNGNPNP